MNDDEKLDLTPLDPARDGERWQALIARTTRLALATRRPSSVLEQLCLWRRPALAAAAAAAAIIWAGAWLRAPRTSTPGAATSDPAYVLASWAADDSLPSTTQIICTLGVDHE